MGKVVDFTTNSIHEKEKKLSILASCIKNNLIQLSDFRKQMEALKSDIVKIKRKMLFKVINGNKND